MVKILGIADLLVTALLLADAFNFEVPLDMLIFISVALFLKALIFFFDIGSFMDMAAAVLLVLGIFLNIPPLILFIVAAFIGLKGFMSLLAH